MSESEVPELRTDFKRVEERLRERLAQRPRARLGDLEERRPLSDSESLMPAAVAVLLERVPGYNMILTKRTESLEHHKGEISLAGGARDPEDADLTATALREAQEEIGLDPDKVTVLGVLDELVTVTRFRVTPVVCAVDAGLEYRLHAPEVERLLKIPMRVLRAPSYWFDDVRTWRGKTYRLRSCRYGDDIVWGATSRILQNFLKIADSEVL